ncbi:hypothetical protein CTI12_AA618820 [Artemisia annua]|uniref:Replication protein A 70 kDa DNA-binding subunit B/D first OB fold domain-containing protein n=1 Tax=Artemisia annua TaxID=35608 RepID=A0A2U1KDM7_ARTAN|nr:hypothetical protein CTI12_AA618820 [Artemisia annua]
MADQAITALSDIDPMLDDCKILVRVVRVWKAHPITRPNEVWSLEGNRIQASIKKADMNKFQAILDEGSCYKVGSFGVGENGGKFPLLSHHYKIGFYKNMSVTRVAPFDQNTRGFRFEPFQNFTRRQFSETDIVGVESEKLQVAYVREPDEWYYEGEWEAYKDDLADEKERKKLEAENDKEEQRKRRLLLAKDHERQLSSMPRMNLFEDDNQDDGEYVSDDEEVEYYDYENAHLYFSAKEDPKFNL